MNKEESYPEFLAEVADVVATKLIELKIPEQESAKIGLDVAEHLRRNFGGESPYFPKGISFECSRRDIEILEMFEGSNFREVCEKFNVTRRRIYQILQATKTGRQPFLKFEENDDK